MQVNLAFVLYRRSTDKRQHLLVRLLFNEQVVPIPGCSDSSIGFDCPLSTFLKAYAPVGDPKIFDELCGTNYYNTTSN